MAINKTLILTEKQRKAARRLRRVLGKNCGGDLLKVSVTNRENIQELTQKEEIERACLEEN